MVNRSVPVFVASRDIALASRDIALFCDAVKDLVQAIYGSGHPYIEKHTAASKALQHDLGEGMSVLKSIRKQVEYSSHLGH